MDLDKLINILANKYGNIQYLEKENMIYGIIKNDKFHITYTIEKFDIKCFPINIVYGFDFNNNVFIGQKDNIIVDKVKTIKNILDEKILLMEKFMINSNIKIAILSKYKNIYVLIRNN